MKTLTRILSTFSLTLVMAYSAHSQDVFKAAPVGVGSVNPLSHLEVSGSFGKAITTTAVTGATILDATYSVVIATPTTSAYTITLPANAATTALHRIYTIVYNGVIGTDSSIIINGNSSNLYFDGTNVGTTYHLKNGSITLQYSSLPSAGWYLTAKGLSTYDLGTVTSVTANSPLTVANSTTTPTLSLIGAAGSILYGTGAASAFSGVGTAGYLLVSNGAGAPTWLDPAAAIGDWSINGNANVTASNFLGPINDVPLFFNTANASGVANGSSTYYGGVISPQKVGATVEGNTEFGSSGANSTIGAGNFGTYNVVLGGAGGYTTSVGSYNVAGGYLSMNGNGSNTTASYDISFGGYLAMRYVGNGVGNIAFQEAALYSLGSGSYNIGIGNSVYDGPNSGSMTANYNTAVGNNAFRASSNYNGGSNTGIGSNALVSASGSGSRSTAVGDSALNTTTTSTFNTGIGYSATATGATNSTAIGYLASSTQSNSITLGNTAVNYNTSNAGSGIYLPGYGTVNSILYTAATTGQVTTFATGTSGQVLQANGPGNVPSWTTPSFSTTGNVWLIGGNGSTTTGTNFIGTLDDNNIVFKINNTLTGSLDPTPINAPPGGIAGPGGNGNVYLGYPFSGSGTSTTGGSTGDGGTYNVAIGNGSLNVNSALATGNIALGTGAMYIGPLTGSLNIAAGYTAGQHITSGTGNIGISDNGFSNIATGNYNTYLGYESAGTGSGGAQSYNTGIGAYSMFNNTAGYSNTAVGYRAGTAFTAGKNTAIGDSTLYSVSSGEYNTALGYQANVTGNPTNATVIGYLATTAVSNSVVLGTSVAGIYLPKYNTPGSVYYTAATTGLVAPTTVGTANYLLQSNGTAAPTWVANTIITNTLTWNTIGNSSIVPGTNFLGTTDDNSLTYRVNNLYAGSIDPTPTSAPPAGIAGPGGNGNVYLGYNVLNSGGTLGGSAGDGGTYNVGIGGGVIGDATTGANYNVALGNMADHLLTTGAYNISVGYDETYDLTTGAGNVAFGYNGLHGLTTGSYNTEFGYETNYNGNATSGGTGNFNTGIGELSLYSITTGSSNTHVGYHAGYAATGDANTSMGDSALAVITSGAFNSALGYQALYATATATSNYITAIGYQATLPVSTSNAIALGNTAVTYNASTGTGLYLPAYGTVGALLYTAAANGQVSSFAPGTSGQVLQANGLATTPTWVTPSFSSATVWNTTGNAGTIPGTDFVGTVDNNSLLFKVDALPAGIIDLPTTNVPAGNGNAYLGFEIGYSNSGTLGAFDIGTNNTAVGQQVIYGITPTATRTVAVGYQPFGLLAASAGTLYVSGADNIAFGYRALKCLSSGSGNIGFDPKAGANSLGNYNTDFGYFSMCNTNETTENDNFNTFVGYYTAQNVGTYNSNTGIGTYSLTSLTSSHNAAVGDSALASNAAGTYNSGAGYQALAPGLTFTSVIGAQETAAVSNAIYLGNAAVAYNASTGAGLYLPGYAIPGSMFYTNNINGLVGAVGAGTPGQVLQSNGTAVPSWVTPASSSVAGFVWNTTGNTGIVYNTDFLGTLNNAPLEFKVAAVEYGVIDPINANVYFGNQAGNENSAIISGAINNVAIGNSPLLGAVSGTSNNVAIGDLAGTSLNSVSNNNGSTIIGGLSMRNGAGAIPEEAFGFEANYNATSGSAYNTIFGDLAGWTSGAGTKNLIVGDSAMYSSTAGSNNTAIGTSALRGNSGSDNTAVGRLAEFHGTSGVNNTSIGYQALSASTSGAESVAIGYDALQAGTGSTNTAVGSYALHSNSITNTSGSGPNVAIGDSALAVGTGAQNVAIGYAALTPSTSGAENTAIGYKALTTTTTGTFNTALGANTVTGAAGAYNTAIGNSATANGGTSAATGSTALGYSASATANNSTAIGANAIANTANTVILGGTGANAVSVGIGTQTPQQELEIGGTGNTIRIDGIAGSNTYVASPSLTTDQVMFAKSTGDMYSAPNSGSSGQLLEINSIGVPSWQNPTTISATAPIYISGSNIYLNGSGDGVFYGTGIAPTVGYGSASTAVAPIDSILVGQGSGAPPRWANISQVPNSPDDNWGTQSAVTDSSFTGGVENTITGNGLSATPLRLSKDGAAINNVLAWNGTTWKPTSANASVSTKSITYTGSSSSVLVGGGSANSVVGASNVTLDVQGAASNTGGIFYSTGAGTSAVFTSTGTPGNIFESNGTAAPAWVSPGTVFNVWGFVGGNNISPTYGTNFLGTINNVPLMFKSQTDIIGIIDPVYNNVYFGAAVTAQTGPDIISSYIAAVGNVALGGEALHAAVVNTNYDVAIGVSSLQNYAYSNNNWGSTAVGYGSLLGSTGAIGLVNEAFGYDAATTASNSSTHNIYFGYKAGISNTTNSYNVGVGDSALYSVSTINGTVVTDLGWNTAVGTSASRNLTTGAANTTIGRNAGDGSAASGITTGIGNTAVGADTKATTSGYGNTAVGTDALYSQTTGSQVTAIGANALKLATSDVTTGQADVVIGDSALANPTSSEQDIVIGSYALRNYTTAGQEQANAVGFGAMYNMGTWTGTGAQVYGMTVGYKSEANYSVQSGSGNFTMGAYALLGTVGNTLSGGQNVAVGFGAMGLSATSAASNVAIGSTYSSSFITPSTIASVLATAPLGQIVSGTYNVAIGYASADALTTGSYNIAVGPNSAVGTTGSDNIAVGYSTRASANNTGVGSGLNNTAFGYQAIARGGNNSTAIGAYASADTANTVIIGSINGINGATAQAFVGIGTQTPQQALEIGGTGNTLRVDGIGSYLFGPATTTDKIMYTTPSGDLSAIPNGTSGQVLELNSGIPSWVSPVVLTATPPLYISSNNVTLSDTNFGVLYGTGIYPAPGSGASATSTAPLDSILVGQGGGLPPRWANISQVPGSPDDNWGSQVAVTDSSNNPGGGQNTITGSGLASSPLKLAKNGATTGQTLKWTGTTWAPGSANGSLSTHSITNTGASSSVVVGNGANQVIGAANVTLDVQGALSNKYGLYYSTGLGTSALFTGTGTSTYVLSSNGTGVPQWVNPATAFNATAWAFTGGNTWSAPYGTYFLGTLNNQPLVFKGSSTSTTGSETFDLDPVNQDIYFGGDVNGNWTGGDNAQVANAFNNVAMGNGALGAPVAGTSNNVFIGYADATPYSAVSNNNGSTVVGQGALRWNSTGIPETVFGVSALGGGGSATPYGNNNDAFGFYSEQTRTSGTKDLGIGDSSLYSNTTTNYNTAIGTRSLVTTTGTGNTAIGRLAEDHGTTGGYNFSAGYQALSAATTGSESVGIGYNAAGYGAGGTQIAIGANALKNSTVANAAGPNVAVGDSAMYASTSGAQNVALGFAALTSATTGADNAVVGYAGATHLLTGSLNTGIGANTILGQTVSDNTAIGYSTTANGGNSTALGAYATAIATNSTAIGDYAYASQPNTLIIGSINGVNGASASASVGIQTQTPRQALEIGGTANTIRIDGIANGKSYSGAPSVSTDQLMFAKATGDVYSMPNGSIGQSMVLNSAGIPTWANVTTLTGSAPLVITGNLISLQGTPNGIFYGLGVPPPPPPTAAFTAAGASGYVLEENTTGAPFWTSPPVITYPADNWGSQVVQTNSTLTGNGLSTNPLGIAQQGATANQVLAWNGTTWLPGAVNPSLTTANILNGGGSSVVTVNNGTGQVVNSALGNVSLDITGTAGGILVGNGTGTSAAFTSAGTAGYLLTSTGTATAPTWQVLTVPVPWGLSGNAIVSGNVFGTTNALPIEIENDAVNAGTIDLAPPTGNGNTDFGGEGTNNEVYGAGGNDGGTYNVALGMGTLAGEADGGYAYNSGSYNVALGGLDNPINETGSSNISAGFESVRYNSSGSGNVGIGGSNSALTGNGTLTGVYSTNYNTAFGQSCMSSDESAGNGPSANVNGNSNVAIGYGSLFMPYGSGGGYPVSNVSIGCFSLYNETASRNTTVGDSALITSTSGELNSAMGYDADNTGALTGATSVGAYAYASTNNTIVLGQIAGINNSIHTTVNTHVGIGTNSPKTDAALAIETGHIETQGQLASGNIVANVTNAGSGATATKISAEGATDVAGGIIINTGSGTLSTGGYATVTFATPYIYAPIVQLTPANAAAANAMTTNGVYVTDNTGSFTINFAVAGSTGTVYDFNYYAIETPGTTSSIAQACHVPVTLNNVPDITSATPVNFQQMVTVNSSSYSSEEMSGLQNVEFTTGSALPTGTPVYAWLESGASSSSTSSIWWVNLGSTQVPAGGTLVIYMNFLTTAVMSSTSSYTGEAPQLSITYGQYDNGSHVFSNYWNFPGPSLPSGLTATTDGGTVTTSSGLAIYAPVQWGDYVTTSSSLSLPSGGIVVETDMNNTNVTGSQCALAVNPSSTLATEAWAGMWQIYSSSIFGFTYDYNNGGSVYPQNMVGTTPAANTNLNVWSLGITGSGTLGFGDINYTSESGASSAYTLPSAFYIGLQTTQGTADFEWLRTRIYPPANFMPTQSFGTETCP